MPETAPSPSAPPFATAELPTLYSRWIAAALDGPVPKEARATCDDCAMLVKPERPLLPTEYSFNPITKCCTYVPELPNFLLGRILADDDPAMARGRAAVEARLAENNAVTPFGLGRPPGYMVVYRQASDTGFGRLRSLRCPYYLEDVGRCGVWKHRESMCATWHCKYVRGAVGLRFWQALHQFLFAIERALTIQCVLDAGLGTPALRRLFPPMFTRQGPADFLESLGDIHDGSDLWGPWRGREREFFVESARRCEALDLPRVLELGGPEARAHLELTRAAYRDLLSEQLPERLRVNAMRLVAVDASNGQFWTYSNLDGLEMPTRLLDVLHCFDGKPTHEAIHEVFMETGINLEDRVVRQLADFEVLIPVDAVVKRK
jgi:hypothetical protein